MTDSKELTEAREKICQLICPLDGMSCVDCGGVTICPISTSVVGTANYILNLKGEGWHIEVVRNES
jgi:hypothetical protein